MKKILAFAGSNSPLSINYELVQAASKKFSLVQVHIINLVDVSIPIYSEALERQNGIPEQIKELHQLFCDADGFLVASPEHNGLPPAFFKNILDWLSRISQNIFQNKPVVLLSTSNGSNGGNANLQILKKLFPRWGATIISDYSLSYFNERFDRLEKRIIRKEDDFMLNAAMEKLESSLIVPFICHSKN